MTRLIGTAASFCLLFVLFEARAQDVSETVATNWRCFKPFDLEQSAEPVMTLPRVMSVGTDQGYGVVSVRGMKEQGALFVIEGINRRWCFGSDLDYSFIVKPDGIGLYYDFCTVEDGGTTTPKDRFICRSG